MNIDLQTGVPHEIIANTAMILWQAISIVQ